MKKMQIIQKKGLLQNNKKNKHAERMKEVKGNIWNKKKS